MGALQCCLVFAKPGAVVPSASFVLARACDALELTKSEGKKGFILIPSYGIQISGGPSLLSVYSPWWMRARASDNGGL